MICLQCGRPVSKPSSFCGTCRFLIEMQARDRRQRRVMMTCFTVLVLVGAYFFLDVIVEFLT